MIKAKIEEWKDKKLLNGYFGNLANSLYKRLRIKNSEILQLLIYGAYIEEQNKLKEPELDIMQEDVNYYYQEGQKEVNNTLPLNARKSISLMPDSYFGIVLGMMNAQGYVWDEYQEMIMQYNAQQMYRQVAINIQQNKENDIYNNVFQNLIKKQQNTRLNINGDKISGAVDSQLIGMNNRAKVDGMLKVDNDTKVRFIAVEDKATTPMCHSLDGQTFSVNNENEFNRYYGETSKDLRIEKIKCKGLVIGLNLPPISHHFHYCRSTITYIINKNEYEEFNPQYINITNKYKGKNKYILTEKNYFLDKNNNKYKIDGKSVRINANKKERQVAELMGEIYGGKVELVPVVLNPKGIKTPDYLINGNKYDLKEIKGNNENTLYNALAGKKEQAENFIFDVSNSKLELNEINEQINNIYNSKHRSWIEQIVIIKDNELISIYKRK